MGLLERAIRKGVSKGVGEAVGKAISDAIKPSAEQVANRAAQQIDQAAEQQRVAEENARKAEYSGVFGNLERSMQNYATQVGKNTKICTSCGEVAKADEKFCPKCGAKLPERTVAEGAVCPNCGKQNNIGMKFCSECGTKLPAAIEEEEAEKARDEAELAQWENRLFSFPKWNQGGKNYIIEDFGDWISFAADFESHFAAKNATENYRQYLLQCGFRPAGKYANDEHLYAMVDGKCYHVDFEHCFEGDPNRTEIGFTFGEPEGGFNYVKPEPKKQFDLGDLKGLFKK